MCRLRPRPSPGCSAAAKAAAVVHWAVIPPCACERKSAIFRIVPRIEFMLDRPIVLNGGHFSGAQPYHECAPFQFFIC